MKEQFKEPSLDVKDFKNKNPQEMAEAITANLNAVSDEIWEIFLEKINSWKGQPMEQVMNGYRIIYNNLDAVLGRPVPDSLLLALYGNATNIFKDSEDLRRKIVSKNPKLIESKWRGASFF
ncbi:hypothetical protein COV49_00100 [Candidatus Falkowbacteria bacterium CG11_big_fil_rev_8_21_14_0_20_39_10]|uniref:Uncharacterized protein n=1 Tax=Candidatus Falkowbacteria bacterium CG11_big_fil_rev_8_21_14_0_20_39_10 TaxID=1974570 RepID=A0A2M6KA82_9BACT|nr:MAG: hypothetical protein COV49_00100 [Candidatus Falkowbacteria bacterium CG11_big_fil_rev_8_21_14_0_20_39_10]